ncbi:pyrroloquinoline quinone biosynthesis peptide chaperone PqqD [Marinobacter halodurans]|uniref:PqqA binding protein n=1 Tax=Marinobacter halodurans TaxID=2528979 RepID=A0ABY1ZJC0_9GAMM|nr:pyrroloquinoline quinone biosynthesis peptide chaperone PqqD [Marinobacter halodurans]TBW52544.1 pyrroloquinoline quinone biosynthesis peptide chaperone PqqD [Marinobacter halodurans]
MNTQVPRLRPGFRFQWEPAQQAHVLLYPEGMVKLNTSAGAILEAIDGQRSVAEIIAALEARFPDAGPLANDICDFLEDARERHWIILE